MKFSCIETAAKRKTAEVLVIPFWKGKGAAELAAKISLPASAKIPLEKGDFVGKEAETLTLYDPSLKEGRAVFLGLGEKKKASTEKLRRAFGAVCKLCQSKKWERINLLFPVAKGIDVALGVAEGLLLTNYLFEKLKSKKAKKSGKVLLSQVCFVGAGTQDLKVARECLATSEGVYLARDLVNGNADEITPQALAKHAQLIARKFPKVKATIFDKKRIEKEKMGLLLAVSRGSSRDPAFIILEYRGNPKSKEKTVVVGKGVTYDTGGLNLKPTGHMETMKADMGGAAAALGTLYAVANLGLKVNLTAVVPSTENSIGANSYKPGDVYTSHAGKTVEIGNTDAEGRLILADALSYVNALKPTRVIDFATLTGSIVVSLGEETTGLMGGDDALCLALTKAGEKTYERVWRMPLFEEYKKQLKSDVADINNIGGREAGAITAALFLQEFVDSSIAWAHLDIAGTAFLEKARRYHPKNATGVGVRLMVEFLKSCK